MPLSTDQIAADLADKYIAENAADWDHNKGRKDAEEMAVAAKAVFLAGFKAGFEHHVENEGAAAPSAEVQILHPSGEVETIPVVLPSE